MRALWVMMLAALSGAWGQKISVAPAPTGTVTGRVTFAETRQPARLVEVTLARRPEKAEVEADIASNTDSVPERKTPRITSVSGRAGLDGTFTISGIPPGEYYALAKLAGYILPIAPITDEKLAADPDAVMREIPRVTVKANAAAEVNLELHRGGTITGRVQFEDGAPVVEAFINAEIAEAKTRFLSVRPFYLEQAVRMESERILTDSEGRFAIVGLQPGRYTVSTTVITSGGVRIVSDGVTANFRNARQGRVTVPIYAPAMFRKKDARVIEIKDGERVGDVLIEVRLSGVHTIRGTVLAKEDRHVPNQGYVTLKDEVDKTFSRFAPIQEDGSFELSQVPPGAYTLTVPSAQDVADPDELDQQKEPMVLRDFTTAKLTIVVLRSSKNIYIVSTRSLARAIMFVS